jgi:hypothetical protein
MNESAKRKLAIAGLSLFVVSVVYVGYRVWRFLSVMKQHANAVNARLSESAISSYRAEHGRLPATLVEAEYRKDRRVQFDEYGRAYLYEKQGEAFILVSYGRDGKPDGTDYWSLREQPMPEHPNFEVGQYSICGHFDADMVISDRGVHRACGVK